MYLLTVYLRSVGVSPIALPSVVGGSRCAKYADLLPRGALSHIWVGERITKHELCLPPAVMAGVGVSEIVSGAQISHSVCHGLMPEIWLGKWVSGLHSVSTIGLHYQQESKALTCNTVMFRLLISSGNLTSQLFIMFESQFHTAKLLQQEMSLITFVAGYRLRSMTNVDTMCQSQHQCSYQ